MRRSLYMPFFESVWTLALTTILVSVPVWWFFGIWWAVSAGSLVVITDRVLFPLWVYILIAPEVRFTTAYMQVLEAAKDKKGEQ